MKGKQQKEKNTRGFCKRYGILCGIMLLLFCFCACKKENSKGQSGNEGQTTPLAGAEGFADANEALVKERAETYAKQIAVTVGDIEVSMSEAMYLIYSMEVQGNNYALYYAANFGGDYWNMVYDAEGRTTRDVYKEETMDMLIQYAVLYDCAIESGMGLTTEEQQENVVYVEGLKQMLTSEETERGGFTAESLLKTCSWIKLGEKYYSKITDNLGITKDSVRETINKEDYKEYKTEYLYLSTTYYDENYNVCQEDDSVKEERMAQMRDYYEQAKEGALFETLAATEESVVYNVRTFLAEGQQAEAAYMEAAQQLAEGQLCGPVQTEYGIYLIRMLDDECTETYDAVVEEKYELERSEAFEAAYQELLGNYEVTVNHEVWDEVLMGATVSILE